MNEERIEKKLDAILNLMQKLFIFAAFDKGFTKDQARQILGINANEITDV